MHNVILVGVGFICGAVFLAGALLAWFMYGVAKGLSH